MTLALVLACAEDTLLLGAHQVLELPTEGVSDIADPHVVLNEGVYHLFATNDKSTQGLWTSEDLVAWTNEGAVWQPEPASWADQGEVWAPSVHPGQKDGEEGWYLVYTSGLRIGLAWSDSLAGPYQEVLDHPLVGGGYGGVGDGQDVSEDFLDPLNFAEFSIDAFVFEHEGERILYCTRYSPLSQLIAIPLTGWTETGEPTVVSEPESGGWDFPVNEGPWLLARDGLIHMSFSGNRAESADYAVGAAWASSPWGPFERDPDNPVLESKAEIWGPGHHALVEAPDGRTLIFYHSKVSAQEGFERRIRYAFVEWEGQRMRVVPAL